MICPSCRCEQIITTNSRPTNKKTQTWRRKKCLKCGFIFTTHERIDLSHVFVVKKSNKRERFSNAKLFSGVYRALVGGKRIEKGDAREVADKLTEKLGEVILLSGKKSISTEEIVDLVLTMLKDKFTGAYLRYLAYFKVDSSREIKRNLKIFLGNRFKG